MIEQSSTIWYIVRPASDQPHEIMRMIKLA